jgi:hypothetical protein
MYGIHPAWSADKTSVNYLLYNQGNRLIAHLSFIANVQLMMEIAPNLVRSRGDALFDAVDVLSIGKVWIWETGLMSLTSYDWSETKFCIVNIASNRLCNHSFVLHHHEASHSEWYSPKTYRVSLYFLCLYHSVWLQFTCRKVRIKRWISHIREVFN